MITYALIVALAGSLVAFALRPSVEFASHRVSSGTAAQATAKVDITARSPLTVTLRGSVLPGSDPDLAMVPRGTSIPAGQSSRTFSVATTAGRAGCLDVRATVSRTTSAPARLVVSPPSLSGAAVRMTAPEALHSGGVTAPLGIELAEPATGRGVTVTLASSNPSAVALSATSVLIPAGSRTPLSRLAPTLKTGSGLGCAVISARYGLTTVRRVVETFHAGD